MYHLVAYVALCWCCLVSAQDARQIYTGPSGSGIFNLVVNTPVLLGEEAFAISFYESGSTMQLRREPYSRVSYTYAGVGADGTAQLRRRLRWSERDIDSVLDLQIKLNTRLAFATGYAGLPVELVFREGRGGRLLISVVNDPPLERPKNTGF